MIGKIAFLRDGRRTRGSTARPRRVWSPCAARTCRTVFSGSRQNLSIETDRSGGIRTHDLRAANATRCQSHLTMKRYCATRAGYDPNLTGRPVFGVSFAGHLHTPCNHLSVIAAVVNLITTRTFRSAPLRGWPLGRAAAGFISSGNRPGPCRRTRRKRCGSPPGHRW